MTVCRYLDAWEFQKSERTMPKTMRMLLLLELWRQSLIKRSSSTFRMLCCANIDPLLWAVCYPAILTLSGIPMCVIRFKIALLRISSLNWLSIWRVCNRSPKIVWMLPVSQEGVAVSPWFTVKATAIGCFHLLPNDASSHRRVESTDWIFVLTASLRWSTVMCRRLR